MGGSFHCYVSSPEGITVVELGPSGIVPSEQVSNPGGQPSVTRRINVPWLDKATLFAVEL